jgi:hypothetical protein
MEPENTLASRVLARMAARTPQHTLTPPRVTPERGRAPLPSRPGTPRAPRVECR